MIVKMHSFSLFNGEIVSPSDVRIAAVSQAAFYGKSVFTTIAVYDGDPFLWEKHWLRLADNASRIGLDVTGFSEESVKDALNRTIDINAVKTGRARLSFFDESSGGIWPVEDKRAASLLITTADFRGAAKRCRLTVSPFRINSASPLAGIKSGNYLEKMIAVDEARKHGFDEAVCLNERGEIASGCMTNIFWQKRGRLFTPSLAAGCLPGTTREFVLENLECTETEAGLDLLSDAEAVFLTSAGIGIVEASEIDGKMFSNGDFEIMSLLPAI
jgi:branched-chain amino acid aminotransferase